MSIELISIFSAVVAVGVGWAIVRANYPKPEHWAAACLAIHLVVANLLNRGILLQRMKMETATMLAMSSGVVAVILASMIVRHRFSS